MKIAHVVSTFPPYRGGIGNVCFYQVQGLISRGHSVTVFTPRYRANPEPTSDLEASVVRLRPWLSYGNAAWLPQLLWAIRSYDIIHVHYPCFGIESLWLMKLWRPRAKIILHYQMDVIGQGFLRSIFALHNWLVLPLLLHLSDRILVSSSDYYTHSILTKRHLVHRQKVVAIPNGVDVSFFVQRRPRPGFMPIQAGGSRIVLFVGGLDRAHYFKGLAVLLQAIAITERTTLIVVGSGDLQPQYVDQCRKLGIAERVLFVGSTSNDELVDYYNVCNVLVLPSIDSTEAFGLVILEALACARPVIASNLPGVRALIDHERDGLVVAPKDVQALHLAIERVISNESWQKELGDAGRRKVTARYSWEKVCDALEHMYSEVLHA